MVLRYFLDADVEILLVVQVSVSNHVVAGSSGDWFCFVDFWFEDT